MVRDSRAQGSGRRVGSGNYKRPRVPSSKLDVIRQNGGGAEILYREDVGNGLPQISGGVRGSQMDTRHNRNYNNLNVAGSQIMTSHKDQGGYNINYTPSQPPRYVKPPLYQIYGA